MRLTVVITSLGRGGGERTASVLASGWASQGNDVTLITLEKDDVPAYPLDPAIHLRQLKVSSPARNILHTVIRQLIIVRALRRAIRESTPDLIVSVMNFSNVLTLLATRRSIAPVVIMEQTIPELYPIGWMWEMLRRRFYRRANVLVCSSKPMVEWFEKKTKANTCVIPNPVDLPEPAVPHEYLPRSDGNHTIIGVGRLVPEKGFDLLLQAFSRIASRHPGWSLKIVGEGPLLETLQAQCVELGIANRVEFAGWLQDPFSALRTSDLFVFSSRFEGFGNALCEAMTCGLPVISFDCPSGPAEIIRDNIDGILVRPAENVDALSKAMDKLMSDPQERFRLSARAPEVISRFGIKRVLELWQQLFEDIRRQEVRKEQGD